MDHAVDCWEALVDLGVTISLRPADLAVFIHWGAVLHVEFQQITSGGHERWGDVMRSKESIIVVGAAD